MKRILFDGIPCQSTAKVPFHGGGDFGNRLLKKAIELGYINFDIVFSKDMIVDPDIKKLLDRFDTINKYYVDNELEVYSLLKNNNYDCFFSVFPLRHRNYDINTQFIMLIYGLRPIELPWDEYRYKYYSNQFMKILAFLISKFNFLQQYLKNKHINEYKKLLDRKNYKLIVASEHTKYSLLYFFPFLDREKIKVYPLANLEINFTTNDEEVNKEKNYFLMINGNRYEKNIYRAIKVFDILFTKGFLESKKVVITGCSNYRFFRKIKNRKNFELLSYVPQAELENLFTNAFAFVYPSLNEGFGIPPLWAMKFHVPIIASSATSIPEACGDAALYFAPRSLEDFANRVLQINYNEKLRREMIERGVNQYQKYQQEQHADIITEIFGSGVNV